MEGAHTSSGRGKHLALLAVISLVALGISIAAYVAVRNSLHDLATFGAELPAITRVYASWVGAACVMPPAAWSAAMVATEAGRMRLGLGYGLTVASCCLVTIWALGAYWACKLPYSALEAAGTGR